MDIWSAPNGIPFLGITLHLITHDWRWVWLLTWWVMLFASGLALYAYMRDSLAHRAALLAMSVYVVMPYHLLNQYQRGALAG